MRVGFFTYGMDEQLTGIGRYAVQLSYALKRLEPALEIVLLNPYSDSPNPWYQDFESYPLPRLRKLPAAASLGNLSLHRAALKLELDILHDPCGVAPFLMPAPRYKRVTTVHDAIPFIYPRTQPLLTRAVFQTLVRATRLTADAVLTVSHAAAEDLKTYLRLREADLFVTPLGSTLPAKQPSEDEYREVLTRLNAKRPYFLYVGALHPRKNLARTLEAFVDLRKRRQDAQLVIVGPASWGAHEVLRTVETSAADDASVIFPGYVSDDALHVLYTKAHALVFPSLYEGFGLPALEAMARGTPVITSNVSSLPEVVGDAGILVDPRSTTAITDAMQRLLEDEALYKTLRAKSAQRAGRFTWEHTAQKTLDAYHYVLAQQ